VCLPAGQRLSARGIGRLRIGATTPRQVLRWGRRPHGVAHAIAWCVRGGGRILAAFPRHGRVQLIASTAPSSSSRGVRVGDSLRRVEHSHRDLRRLTGRIWQSGSGSTRVLFALRGGRVHLVAVVDRRLLDSRRLVQSYLSAVDL
jgi:hypothetical protein